MFPYLTRIFWLFVQPTSLIVLLLLAGLLLSFLRPRWPARTALSLALLLLVLVGFSSFGYLLITPLESRFARPAAPQQVTGIVVLGGGLDSSGAGRNGWELNRSGDRFVETLRLALRYPQARIVVAGGSPALVGGLEPEAIAARRFLEAFGIAPGRIELDTRSRNTEENAQFAIEIAKPAEGETWLLVTSAFHMPRSVGLFRRAGFAVVPWPTDYLASGSEGVRLKPDETAENIAVSSIAIREWLGLAGYYLTGRIDEMLPGPNPPDR